jgi:UDP-galactopyranose mutase
MSRFAAQRRVFFVEEPIFDAAERPYLAVNQAQQGLRVLVAHLRDADRIQEVPVLRRLLDEVVAREAVRPDVLWYYTPMSLSFSEHLKARVTVYDCMDELSGFAGAPQGLRDLERSLMQRAQIVFAGGRSLYESKRHLHPNIHLFPSSVDVQHFASARCEGVADPPDQAAIPHPRIGFFGVLDERLDRDLLQGVAALRPDWQFVLVGPVVKIDPASLPVARNIHYLPQKTYAELPRYLGGWDVAMLPFARNAATRFISPTKTPEYLAGGRPVVSTGVTDVVHPYGELGLARIADTPAEFVAAIEAVLAEDSAHRQRSADALLATMSWDITWRAMLTHIETIPGKDPVTCSITSSSGAASPAPSRQSVSPPALEKRY